MKDLEKLSVELDKIANSIKTAEREDGSISSDNVKILMKDLTPLKNEYFNLIYGISSSTEAKNDNIHKMIQDNHRQMHTDLESARELIDSGILRIMGDLVNKNGKYQQN